MKKFVISVVLLAVALAAYGAAGPFIAIHEMKSAAEQQDSERLSAYIDFPTLRANLKEQLNASLMKRTATDLKDNPFSALAMAFASRLVDGMVDSFVTPAGLTNLMEGKGPKQSQGGRDQPQDSGGQKPEPLRNARYTYDNSNKFSVWVRSDAGEEIRFVLSRDGLSWKLSNIAIPLGS